MRVAGAKAKVALPPGEALELWSDVGRWPTFVEGFTRTLETSDDWPEEGARVVWESGAGGRGRVTEKVVQRTPDSFATQVFEEALTGTQRALFEEAEDGAIVTVELEYELAKYGPLRAVADAIFIRRALRDSLKRTLYHFVVEAEEEAGVR